MNIFEILGPIMVGPSSSHTAGAVRIGLIVRRLLGIRPKYAKIMLHGSFAATGEGHGTDKALVAGIMGMKPDDIKIPYSFDIAREEAFEYQFENISLKDAHPNSVLIRITGEDNRVLEVQASSLGGGRIMINKIDKTEVNFTGESPTLIVHNIDQPGHVAEVTSTLSQKSVNIATMHLYRDKRGGYAVIVVETDQEIPCEAIRWLENLEGILMVRYLSLKGDN